MQKGCADDSAVFHRRKILCWRLFQNDDSSPWLTRREASAAGQRENALGVYETASTGGRESAAKRSGVS